jgi:nucleoside-triphosphatase THEP1
MQQEKSLSPVWQRAVIAGSIWGSLEIVLGSALHNLMLPLVAGTTLSFAGVVITVALQRKWREKGLFWRAALICALLKSISPSAVILTPMLCIALEGLLMELGVLLLGNNLLGYIFGGGLAVLSVPAFKVLRLYLLYGSTITDAYMSVAAKLLPHTASSPNGLLLPLLVFSVIYFIIGGIASIIGYLAGSTIAIDAGKISENLNDHPYYPNKPSSVNKWYALRPLFHLIFLVSFLSAFKQFGYATLLATAVVYVAFCALIYPKTRAIFTRPKFILPLIGVSFLVPLLAMGAISDPAWIKQGGRIAARAFVVIVSFSAIGTELGNKNIHYLFASNFMQPIYTATSLAFNTLPGYIAHLKSVDLSQRNPLRQLNNLIHAGITHANKKNHQAQKILLITGDRGSGKTTFIREMLPAFEIQKIGYCGFYAEGEWVNSVRTAFNLVLLPSGETMKLCWRVFSDTNPIKGFQFSTEAISRGNSILLNALPGTIAIVDEVGEYELNGRVWSDALTLLLKRRQNPVVIAVRNTNIDAVKRKWGIQNPYVFDVTTDCPEDAVKAIGYGIR